MSDGLSWAPPRPARLLWPPYLNDIDWVLMDERLGRKVAEAVGLGVKRGAFGRLSS